MRLCAVPDFDAELSAAGVAQARRGRPDEPLAQLYSRSTRPDLAEGVGPQYLSHLFARRSPMPFTKALAEGDDRAHGVLAEITGHLRSVAVDARRTGISSAVSARVADLSHLYVGRGASAMLHRLGHRIRLRHGVLEVPTVFDADMELGDRALRIQAVALGRQVVLAEPALDHLTVRIPAGAPPQPHSDQLLALRALLGTGRAEALEAVVVSGGITGQQLASRLGVSNAAASRSAAVLRRTGLIRSLRMGQSVRHVATPLGYHLAQSGAATGR
ncbi:ArsR family transcriptional regulator [Streptomyces sp. L2]|uniref:ArsR family transcriptional regulator n=1 Tax=Streptomyces sp. L2 TaxID=2162665 RepID=UPI001F507203|nr:ArsR family transcriptional regulator [Streptomyces sp. L2]